MQRKFISNLGFLIFVNLLVKPLYIIGIDLTVQNTLGEDVYGLYYPIFKFAIIFNIILDLGIENFNRREIARDENRLNIFFSNFISLKLLLGCIYLLITITIGLISGYSLEELKILIIVLLNEFLRSLILYFRANLGGLHKFKSDSIFSVFDRLIMIIICGSLLINQDWREQFKLEWFVLCQTLAYLISAFFAFLSVYRNIKKFQFKIKKEYSLVLLKKLWPYAILIFLMSIYTHGDPFLIERILDDGRHQAGIYAQGFRLLEACANYGYLFAIILLPIFSRMLKTGERIENLLRLSYFLIIVPSLLAVVGFNVFQKEIISLYTNQYSISPKIFGTLMFSLLGISTTYIYGTLLTANGNLKQLNIIALVGVIISISLNLILIPRYKAYGASFANLSSQLITAILQIYLVTRIFKIKPNYKRMIQLPFYFLLLFFGGIYIRDHLDLSWYSEFFIIILIGTLITLSLVRKDLKQFLHLLKSEKVDS